MKICYLILAHNNFKHLDRLIETLDDGNSNFAIHIDKKVQEEYKCANPNAAIIPARIDINWGGYSMIDATAALMQYAFDNYPADYYIFISGVDYPIRSRQFLYNLLEEGKEYIDIAPLPVPNKPMERYEYYYFDYNRRELKHYNPLFLLEVLMKKLRIKRKLPFKIFVGTQWFALTRACVEYILDTMKNDSMYEKFFRHSLVPDEAFFQTIIGNSPFWEKTASSLTYTDWNVPVPPAEIGQKHVQLLKNKEEFNDEYGQRFPYFARKFNDNSIDIIGNIKEELWR